MYVPAPIQSNGRQISPFWGTCPLSAIRNDPGKGYLMEDDFMDLGLPGTQTSEINLGRYKVYNTGSGKVIPDALPHASSPLGTGGIISMLCDTDGDQSVIGTHQCPFSLASTAGPLWFEARIATTAITTTMTHIFVGLGNNFDVTFGAAIPLANANALGTAVAAVGWNRLESGLGVLNTSYCDEAAAWTDVQATAGSIAANTWVKLGMYFNPADSSRALRFFANGAECVSAITASTLSGLTHLDASGLGFCFAQFADSGGTANYAYCDWYKIAQLTP